MLQLQYLCCVHFSNSVLSEGKSKIVTKDIKENVNYPIYEIFINHI
jgi:hypothetical protein